MFIQERLFGSTMFIILNIGLILLSGGVYLAVTWLCTLVTGDISWLMYSSVGCVTLLPARTMAISRNRCLARVCVCRYSGILFAFASLESFLSPAPTRSLFGMITVPTRLYPWALLIVLQLLPNISLLGHLSGLIVGMLCVPASVSRATYVFVCMCLCGLTQPPVLVGPAVAQVFGRVAVMGFPIVPRRAGAGAKAVHGTLRRVARLCTLPRLEPRVWHRRQRRQPPYYVCVA